MTYLNAACVLMFATVLILGLQLRGPRGAALVSSYKLVLGLLFLYMLLPAVLIIVFNGGEYVWIPQSNAAEGILLTTMACIFATIAFIIGYGVRLHRSGAKRSAPQRAKDGGKIARIVALIFITAGLLIKLYVAISSGGAETNIVRFSPGLRDSLGVESISSGMVVLRYLSGIADAGATWLLLETMRSGKRLWPAAILFIFVVTVTFLGAGKRLFILWPLLAALIGIHHYIKPIRIRSLPAIGIFMFGLGFVSLMFRIYVPALIAGVQIDLNQVEWSKGSLLRFYLFSLEFASFETLTFILRDSDSVVGLFGSRLEAFYRTNIEPLAYFIPREAWPSKPDMFLDLSHAYRVFVTGGALDASSGVAATILGTSWTLGGPIGFLLALFSLGMLCRLIDSSPSISGVPRVLTLCWYALGLVTVFHLFRQGTVAWTAIIVLLQQSGMIFGFIFLSLADSRLTRRSSHFGSKMSRPVPTPYRMQDGP